MKFIKITAFSVALFLAATGIYAFENPGMFDSFSLAIKNYFAASNVEYLSPTDSIDTAITNATAGDSIILAAGTYTITDDIDVTKSVSITGQGRGLTNIVTVTDSINCFEITANDVTIQDLSIGITASTSTAVYANGSTGSGATGSVVLSGILIKDVDITMNSHTGSQSGIKFLDAGGEVRDVVITATSSNNAATGVEHQNDSITATYVEATETTVDCYGVNVSVTAGGSYARGFYSYDNSSTCDSVLSLYNSTSYATGATDHAAEAANGDAYLYAEGSTFEGDSYDAINTGTAGGLRLRNCNLVNNLTSGVITRDGTNAADNAEPLSKGFTLTAAIATDDFLLGWRPSIPITITEIYGVVASGTVVGMVYICDKDTDLNDPLDISTDCDPCDSSDITFDGGEDSDTALAGGVVAVEAGSWPAWVTTSVITPGPLAVSIYYTVD